MVTVTFITADGREQVAEIDEGISLMEGAVGNGIDGIEAECGGNCYCGTCRVYVEPDWQAVVGGQGEFETPVIETTGDENPNVRLSCQIAVTDKLDGLVVRLPENQT
ncbi:MAG: 2Fe-2S iron-sulfur cluster-binding protein [Novosphingobium sp.]|nr:(2Fe-2S)-binding protein [Novosphingobium sp.]